MTDAIRDQLDQYVTDLFVREDEVFYQIQVEAEKNGLPAISIRPFEGRLLQFLVYATGAKKIVEIGTLAGYSGAWIARALPTDGRLYTLEVSRKHAAVARSNFQRAGVGDKVEVVEGSALDSLRRLAARGPFDIVFIDADKGSYIQYLEWAVQNLRPGGLVAAHNAFLSAGVLHLENDSDRAIDAFNRALAADRRLESTILAIGDGLAVGVKKTL